MKMQKIKTGGRLKGTPNRMTKESKAILAEIVNNEIENLPALMEQLEPRERAYILVKLLPYVVPKLNPNEMENREPVIIQIPANL